MGNSAIYYSDFYWNDITAVKEHINLLISGDKKIDYINNFKNKIKRKFKKALVLNCGNGHVEREFIKNNVIESAIGIDISEDLIAEANLNKENLDISYIQHDINTFDFSSIEFDLLIVFAAGHHIQYLNRVFFEASKILIKNNGMIVGFDYIGPHRNQYSLKVWNKTYCYNQKLPKFFQNKLIYPHLPTMLVTDPSEAIHSEYLEESLNYYFDLDITMLGGGIAYEILSHNEAAKKMNNNKKQIEELNKHVLKVLEWDLAESKKDHKFNFFASFYGYPKKYLNELEIEKKILEENDYEKKFPLGSNYYPKTFLQNLTEELSDKSVTITHKQAYIDECHIKLDKCYEELDKYQKRIDDLENKQVAVVIKKLLKKFLKKLNIIKKLS